MHRTKDTILERNWHYAAKDWRTHAIRGRQLSRQLGPGRYLEIYYEQLLCEPAQVFETILRFWDNSDKTIRQNNKIRTQISGFIQPNNFNKWKTALPDSAVKIIEQTAGDLLHLLGYELIYPELLKQKFSGADLLSFTIDRYLRKIFSRTLIKSLKYRYSFGLTRLRSLVHG